MDIPNYMKDLRSPYPKLRNKAAYELYLLSDSNAMKSIAESIVPELIIALGDSEDSVREKVVQALGNLGDIRAVAPLINCLLNDGNESVKEEVAEALGRLGHPSAVTPLLETLVYSETKVRFRSAMALGLLKDNRAMEPLINAMRGDDEDIVRMEAAAALGNLGNLQAFESLIIALKDSNEWVRRGAAIGLGDLRDPRAHQPLKSAFLDPSSMVKPMVIRSLGLLGDKRAVEELIHVLHDKVYDNTFVIQTIISMGDVVVETLMCILDSNKEFISSHDVVEILHGIRTEKAVEALDRYQKQR